MRKQILQEGVLVAILDVDKVTVVLHTVMLEWVCLYRYITPNTTILF